MSTPRGIAILGSTGSIGRSTLAVIGLHPDRFRVAALGAYADVGDRYFRAHTLIHLGETYQASGDRPGAREAWRQALEILDDLHHHDAEAVRARLQDVTVTASGRSPVAAW